METSKRSQVDPFIVMDVMEAARKAEDAGRHIIHMEVGQPGTAAPKTAREAVRDALDTDALGYTVALGLPELRREIAGLYQRWYGIDLDPSRVVVTAGSSAGFLLAFTALFDAGQNVGIGAPGYPSYRQILKALSLNPIDIQTTAASKFQLTPEDLTTNDLHGALVASPANPTGTMLGLEELSALIHTAHDNGISFISDEIYHGIEYETKSVTALSVSDDVYVINSFSKYFSMTGWRVGWMIVPPDHVRTIERLAQNMFICPTHASQVAALGALRDAGELDANLSVYQKNRDLMVAGLREIGFANFAPPDGAFYIYADISNLGVNSRDLAHDILEYAGVAITPGLDFDPVRGAHTVRFSYARATEDIEEGLVRLRKFMQERFDV